MFVLGLEGCERSEESALGIDYDSDCVYLVHEKVVTETGEGDGSGMEKLQGSILNKVEEPVCAYENASWKWTLHLCAWRNVSLYQVHTMDIRKLSEYNRLLLGHKLNMADV